MFYLVTLVYPRCAQTCLQLFSYMKLDIGTYLYSDFTILVRDTQGHWAHVYLRYLFPGIALLLVFAIGLPIWYLVIMYLHPQPPAGAVPCAWRAPCMSHRRQPTAAKTAQDADIKQRFGFLYGGYSFQYWETMDMLRKLVLGGIPVFIAVQPEGSLQVNLALPCCMPQPDASDKQAGRAGGARAGGTMAAQLYIMPFMDFSENMHLHQPPWPVRCCQLQEAFMSVSAAADIICAPGRSAVAGAADRRGGKVGPPQRLPDQRHCRAAAGPHQRRVRIVALMIAIALFRKLRKVLEPAPWHALLMRPLSPVHGRGAVCRKGRRGGRRASGWQRGRRACWGRRRAAGGRGTGDGAACRGAQGLASLGASTGSRTRAQSCRTGRAAGGPLRPAAAARLHPGHQEQGARRGRGRQGHRRRPGQGLHGQGPLSEQPLLPQRQRCRAPACPPRSGRLSSMGTGRPSSELRDLAAERMG